MAIIVIIVIIVLIYKFVIQGQNNKRRSLVIDGLDVVKHISARAPVADSAGDVLSKLSLQRLHLPQMAEN